MITIRYFAGARAAAGTAEEKVGDGVTVAQLLQERPPELARVLHSATFLVDGLTWHDRHAILPAGAVVDVLPPFAGG